MRQSYILSTALLMSALSAQADIRVSNVTFLASTRISATLFDYTFSVTAYNNGPAARGVTATVTSYASATVVRSGSLTFPDIPAGGTITSSNTFTVRQAPVWSRAPSYDPSQLRIDFTATTMPTANAGPDQVCGIGVRCFVNGRGSYDSFGKPLTYTWKLLSAPPGSAAVLDNPAGVAGHFTPDVAGNYLFSLVVNNGGYQSAPSTMTISTTVSRPVADAGRDQTVKTPGVVQLDGSGSTNPMGRLLSYSWQVLSTPAGSSAFDRSVILSDPSAVRPTFAANIAGEYRVQLVVTDGALASAPSVVTITTGNTPPLADAGPDLSSVGAPAQVLLQGGRSTDVNNDFLTYRWFVLSRPPNSTAAPSATDPNAIFQPDVAGLYHLQVNVSDGKSESIATLIVNTASDMPPIPVASESYTGATPAFTLDGTKSSTYTADIFGNSGSLSKSWYLLSHPRGSSASVSGRSDPAQLNPDASGVYVVELIAQDQWYRATPKAVAIVTSQAPPVAVVDPIQFISWVPGLPVTLNGSGSKDQAGAPLTYHWTLVNRPLGSTASLYNSSTATPYFVADLNGSYVAQLIVNNGQTSSAPVTETVVSKVNQSPVTSDASARGPQGSSCIPITLSAQDQETGNVAFQFTSLPRNGVFYTLDIPTAPNTANLCYKPNLRTYSGVDVFEFVAVDGGFPYNCSPVGPGCQPAKRSSPSVGIVDVYEVP